MGADMLLAGMRAPWAPAGQPAPTPAQISAVAKERLATKDVAQILGSDLIYYIPNSVAPDDGWYEVAYDGNTEFLARFYTDAEKGLPDGERVTDEALLTIARDALGNALDTILNNPREVTGYRMPNGEEWWFTGGLSHGDPPTEAYEPMNLLGELGLFDSAILVVPGE